MALYELKEIPGRGPFSISWDSWFWVRQRLSETVMHRIQALWTHYKMHCHFHSAITLGTGY